MNDNAKQYLNEKTPLFLVRDRLIEINKQSDDGLSIAFQASAKDLAVRGVPSGASFVSRATKAIPPR